MGNRRTVMLTGLLSAAAPRWAAAHSGGHLTPGDLWSAWNLEPLVLGGLLAASALYARGVRRLWGRAGAGHGIPRWRVACFAGGIGVLLLALVSPLDALGSVLFSAHMTQHLLLMIPAPLLLVLGAPVAPAVHGLPAPSRRRLVALWRRAGALRQRLAYLTWTPFVWVLNTVVLWIWHAPPLFEAALASEPMHGAEHASFLAVSLLLWAAVFPTRTLRQRQGSAVLLVVTTGMQGGLLAAILTFAEAPWYATYELTAHAWGLTPLEDQQLAGAIMWVPSSIAYLVAATLLFHLWLAGPAPPRRHARALRQASLLILAAGIASCGDRAGASALVAIRGGDPDQGRRLIVVYGCGNCHTIPGVRGARGTVGPPLTAFGRRDLIAGKFRNGPEELIAWIMDAPALDPGVAMPDLGVTESQARHIASYLYRLR